MDPEKYLVIGSDFPEHQRANENIASKPPPPPVLVTVLSRGPLSSPLQPGLFSSTEKGTHTVHIPVSAPPSNTSVMFPGCPAGYCCTTPFV